MAFVLTNEGEKLLLEAATGKTAAGNLLLKLYKNNYTPTHTDNMAGNPYTAPAFTGYADKTLTTSSWNAATAGTGSGTSLSNKASITYAAQTFTVSATAGTDVIYGYYITNSGSTVLVGAEIFSTAKNMQILNDAITITPTLTLSTE